jgi:hypothetical protein
MEFAQEGRKARSAFAQSLGRHTIDFAAIAGGKDQGFFEQAARAEFVSGSASLFRSKRQALTQLEWSRPVI